MKSLYLLIPCIVLLSPYAAQAGAWTQPAGSGQVITTFSDYSTEGAFTSSGKSVNQTPHYRDDNVSIYAEYGITDAVTIGFQPNYQWSKSAGNSNSSLGDTSFFVRERVWHNDFNVFSLQELATIPGPYDRHDPLAPGYGQNDLELRGLYGHSGTTFGIDYFIDAEGAYRERFGIPADELHADFTFGLKPIKGVMLLAQSFNTIGLNDASKSAMFVQPSAPNYDLYKLQLSAVTDITHGFSFQVGCGQDVAGRNTGEGTSLFVAIWRSF